ncbi:MAG: FAD-dependent oxidoreductase [Chloroflexota bacterium]
MLIVGGGLAGLAAAQQLAGFSVLVLDKGKTVGGRLTTRHMVGGRADMGAQFFTVRTAVFREQVDDWLARDVVFEWSRGWSDGSAAGGKPDGYPRYAAREGMQSLAFDLQETATAAGVIVQTRVKVVKITAVSPGWQLQDQNGGQYQGRYLMLTPPVPQSLALLARSHIPLQPVDRLALQQIRYAPCLCGLFRVEGDVALPEPGALQRHNHPFSWLANNQRKGISPEAQLITVHAGPEQSRILWSLSPASALAALRQELSQFLGANAAIREARLKRWRYASLDSVYEERFLEAENLPPLLFAGDGFGGPRVEGAFLSGVAVGKRVKERL